MNPSNQVPDGSQVSSLVKKSVLAAVLVIGAVVVLLKINSGGDQKTVEFLPSGNNSESQTSLLPKEEEKENLLLYGGALQKVQDFGPVVLDAAFWSVFRDVKNSDPKLYENVPLFADYKALLANPRHYRFLGKPVRVRGIMNLWAAYPMPNKETGIDDYFRSWLFDGENGYVADGWERPPVDAEGLKRVPVEVTGIFYQIFRYETGVPLSAGFRQAASLLKRGRYERALEEFQNLLEQDPRPALVAKFVRDVDGSLWDEFKAKGSEYAAVVQRLNNLSGKGSGDVFNADVEEQFLTKDAPYFIAKSVRLLEPPREESAFERFMGTTRGLMTFVAGLCILVVGSVFFLLRLQHSKEKQLKAKQEDFWRQVRRNIKGVDPPGGARGGGV